MPSQHVVIVGGSSGIGLATAHRLLDAGFKVTIAGRDKERLRAAKADLGGEVAALAMDASDEARLGEHFAEIGGLDHLVLAFGSRRGAGPFASVDLAEVRQGFQEKVFPHFACAQAALPLLRPGGSITFVSAVSAHWAMPGSAGLGTANAAIAALVPILAAELKPLRVNGVSPGVIDTPWWDFLPQDQRTAVFADFAAKTPLGRIGKPEDVAQAIEFLISDSFVTGHMLICDGGLRFAA